MDELSNSVAISPAGVSAEGRPETLEKVRARLAIAFPRQIKKILLVNPPDGTESLFQYATAKRGRYTNFPPYGLGVLATRLRALGIEVRICNLNNEVLSSCNKAEAEEVFDFKRIWQGGLESVLESFAPDLVGVTCMFTMTHGSFHDVCRHAKSLGFPIAIGGVHVSNDTKRIYEDIGFDVIDIAFTGESDHSFPEFIEILNGARPLDQLSQAVVAIDGEIATFGAGAVPAGEVLDTIPAYDLMQTSKLSLYGVIGAFYCFKPKDAKFATVLSNRGCRGKCTFCSVRSFNGPGVRHRSVVSVADELEILNGKFGIDHIVWLDDDLFKDHRRAITLFNEIVKRNLDLTWDATNGVLAASCTDEVISAAAESGCIALNIGVESGNPEILRMIQKPATVDIYLKAAEVMRKFPEIHTSIFLMVGFPGETMAQINDTINLATDMDMDWYRISQLQPLPGTPIYDAMVQQGMIQPTGSSDVRFNGGAFGKQSAIEAGLVESETRFEDVFSNLSPETVPTPEILSDIWFYMNYRLNFYRIFHESNPIKLKQLKAHLEILADLISPENGFALYFLAWLSMQEGQQGSDRYVERLKERLDTSDYWREKFGVFGLSIDGLLAGNIGVGAPGPAFAGGQLIQGPVHFRRCYRIFMKAEQRLRLHCSRQNPCCSWTRR